MKLRIAGLALMLGGLLFFTRIIPVARVVPDDMVFPPEGAADLARLSDLAGAGWPLSHGLGLIAVILFIFGYWSHARVLSRKGDTRVSTIAAITASVAFLLFAVALIIDGFVVHSAAQAYTVAIEKNSEAALKRVGATHALALKFFTPGIFLMFIAIGLLSSRMIHRAIHYRWLGFFGMFIAILGPTAYLFGVAGPNWSNMQIGGSLMMLGFLWHLLTGLAAMFGRDKNMQ